jgi:hypothetical protein
MPPIIRSTLSVIFGVALLALAGTIQAAPAVHRWNRIYYPPLPIPDAGTEKLTVLVGSEKGDGESHLRFDVMWSGARDARLPAAIADASKFVVRLHLSDGTSVLPKVEGRPPSWVGAGGMGITWSLQYFFPWQRNAMEETWVELAMPTQTYWVELPYGFTRNPADPLPTDDKLGEPVFPPTMKALADKDRLVPWLSVEYDLGAIQNGWRLSLELSNPFDAQAEVVLYREDSRVGGSMFLWKLHTPLTALAIKNQNGKVILTGDPKAIRLHEDGMRRSDDYSLNRYPSMGREWGAVEIKVDKEVHECLVPSSLFKYMHGVTDHGNRLRLSRPPPLRDR